MSRSLIDALSVPRTLRIAQQSLGRTIILIAAQAGLISKNSIFASKNTKTKRSALF